MSDEHLDRSARQRRTRARAHLERVRRGRRRALGFRRRALAISLGALVCGAAFGQGVAVRLLGMMSRSVVVIAVSGARHLTPAAVAGATAIAPSAAIGALDPQAVTTALERHDWIASARALPLPGGTLLVGVVEREPAATIAIGSTVYAVDAEGQPFAELDASAHPGLPRIVAAGEVTPRQTSPRLAQAVRLLRRLPELGLAAPTGIRVAEDDDPEGFALGLATLEADVVLGRGDLDARLEDLARLLAERPDAVAGAERIDLRFADQVVLRGTSALGGSATTAVGRGGDSSRNGRPAG